MAELLPIDMPECGGDREGSGDEEDQPNRRHDPRHSSPLLPYCFVEGCDASVMIASPRNDAEKDAPDNLSLAGDGFDTVIKAKAAVEAQCPGVVSCADILTIAARDVVALSGGPNFTVELGRRDGLVSLASRVAGKLPGPDFNLDSLTTLFGKNNLTLFDMITLSGAHTVGFAHCSRFTNRLYRFGSSSSVDPTINPDYARELMQACPANVGPTIAVNMDPVTPITFDNVYYANLAAGLGLFTSDEVLYADGRSQPVVKGFAGDQSSFFAAFAKSMVKLGRVGVKTGRRGQIRRDCTAFN
ncbi:peroxidase 51-like [Ananas comosus]|uniref:Peroxidase n=1 Tax=Ananas comosus TaxID=4615 RepID=A0A6P5F055_ANACO|nr:peroxidase 51-like [Ananas comosus]